MIKRGVSREVLRAFVALEKNDYFNEIMRFLSDKAVEIAVSSCRVGDDTKVKWMQGQAQALIDIRALRNEAKEGLARSGENDS